MNDVEQRLREHLTGWAAEAQPHPDVDAVLAGASTFSLYWNDRHDREASSGRSRIVAAAAVAALVAGVVGLAASQRLVEQVPPASEVPALRLHCWTTAEYTASARSFAIDVNGKTFVAEDPDIEVSGDPGTPTYQTLEMTWQEHGVEMRWYVYFTSDGNEWWSNEFRTYDGNDPG